MESELSQIDRTKIQLLNTFVQETGAKIIISSAWRRQHTVQELQETLATSGFVGEVVGKTGYIKNAPRSEEIQETIEELDISKFVIVDDDDDAEIDGHFVLVDYRQGLTPENIERAKKILGY